MKRLAVSIVAFALLFVSARPGVASAAERPTGDKLLYLESQVTYRVVPESGPVHVTWNVTLTNNDSVPYYTVDLPVLSGASGVRATGPAGAPLAIDLESAGQGPVVRTSVRFDRTLAAGQQYAFTLSYDLAGVRSDYLLVSNDYVYLPAVVVGDEATVVVEWREDPAWDLAVEPIDCAPSFRAASPTLHCRASTELQVAALVELIRPSALRQIEASVPLHSGDIAVTISYFPAEQAWAEHVRQIAAAALPVLETLFGFAYDGPKELVIAERGRQEIAGYEGIFYCQDEKDDCQIGISPVADDHTALHELAHLWTEPFEKRWLAEGLAEFMSERAGGELGPLVEPREAGPPPGTVDLALDDWGNATFLIGASEDQITLELAGYAQSRRLFEAFEERVGLAGIQQANQRIAVLGTDVDSRDYLDALEATGAKVDDLFRERVFPSSFARLLERRQLARQGLAELQEAVKATDLVLPDSIEQLIQDWSFAKAQQALADANAALQAYQDGRRAAQGSLSLWEKMGLLGKDYDGTLDDAEAAFAEGDFDRAAQRARSAEHMLSTAGREALNRLLIAAAVATGVITLAVGAFWLLRDRKSLF